MDTSNFILTFAIYCILLAFLFVFASTQPSNTASVFFINAAHLTYFFIIVVIIIFLILALQRTDTLSKILNVFLQLFNKAIMLFIYLISFGGIDID